MTDGSMHDSCDHTAEHATGEAAGCECVHLTPAYLDNLCRLGLADIPAMFQYTSPGKGVRNQQCETPDGPFDYWLLTSFPGDRALRHRSRGQFRDEANAVAEGLQVEMLLGRDFEFQTRHREAG